MKCIDETIKNICEWINNELNEKNHPKNMSAASEMTKALAGLVSARGATYSQE